MACWAVVAPLLEAPVAARPDPARWRARLAVEAGAGGAGDGQGQVVTVFPATLELGVQVWRYLSVTAAAEGILSTTPVDGCGVVRAPHAALGTVGLRGDLWNGKSSPWPTPFLEVHGGVGGQRAGGPSDASCPRLAPFGTGGVKVGVDAWLGRVAVTVAFSYDYLPVAAPISFHLGANIVLF